MCVQIQCKVAPVAPELNQVVPELAEEPNKVVTVMSNLAAYTYYLYQFALSIFEVRRLHKQQAAYTTSHACGCRANLQETDDACGCRARGCCLSSCRCYTCAWLCASQEQAQV